MRRKGVAIIQTSAGNWYSAVMVVRLPPFKIRGLHQLPAGGPFAIALHETTMAIQPVYKVIFQNGSQVFEVFARQIYQSDMWGFIEVEEFVFGERSQILVDPSEEKLKNEFSGVKRSYIPLQAIIRIDEVDKEGSSKISSVTAVESSNVTSFPFAGFPPGQKGGEE